MAFIYLVAGETLYEAIDGLYSHSLEFCFARVFPFSYIDGLASFPRPKGFSLIWQLPPSKISVVAPTGNSLVFLPLSQN